MKHRVRGNLRYAISLFLKFTFFIYVLSLPFSPAVADIAGWSTAFFLILYFFADRLNAKRDLEIHTLGSEIPLVALLALVFIGLKSNSSSEEAFLTLGLFRNLILLFLLTYSLQVVKDLNRVISFLVASGVLIAGVSLLLHLTQSEPALLSNPPWYDISGGKDSLINHSLLMILCVPWATILFLKRASWWVYLICSLAMAIILGHFVFTYGRGSWIAAIVILPVMAIFAGRKMFVFTLLGIFVSGFLLFHLSPGFRERAQNSFAENYSNDQRKNLWHINMEMFRDHPWVGVGYDQNEKLCPSYFEKTGIQNGTCDNAHSNYVQWLATGGILGFGAYMLFILTYLLMTARLISIIPTTHFWHRVFALGALGAQVSFHVAGLTQWNFGDPLVQHQFIFWLAVVSYLTQRYFIHIVPDDRSL